MLERKVEEKIAYWRICNPEKRNAISKQLLHELHSSVAELSQTPIRDLPRVLILEGVPGLAFSAGADLKERKTMSRDEVWHYLDTFRDMLQLLETLPIPTIAAVSGVALGGGFEIALAMDFRILREDATLGLPEVRLGIIPGAGGTQRLSRLISPALAKEWILSGRTYNAKEAMQFGVANYCYPVETFHQSLYEFASQFLDSGPVAVSAAKKAIHTGLFFNIKKGLDIERNCYNSTLDTLDRKEALLAFEEKRKPVFRGE